MLGIAEAGTDLELGHQLGWPDTPLHIDGRLRKKAHGGLKQSHT